MLNIRDLTVKVENNKILKNVNLEVAEGSVVLLFGPNGGGKSSLFGSIAGLSKYSVVGGSIELINKNITNLDIDERNKLGLTVMLQSPPAIKGVRLKSLVDLNSNDYEELSKELDVEKFFNRGVNNGLSGGEIKRSEAFQMALDKNAKFYLIDEPDSGVDPENLNKIGAMINQLVHDKNKSALIVTHSGEILNYIDADKAYVLIDGEMRCHGDPETVFKRIQEEGYNTCISCKGELINE